MIKSIYSVITGSGKYIPTKVINNSNFHNQVFYEPTGEKIDKLSDEIIEKFKNITNIEERRYVEDEFVTSDIASFSAEDAIKSSKTDREELDYIIVAHNFGDVKKDNRKSDIVPTLAARVKYNLGIKNPNTVAYDLPFGCPGWLQAVIQANYFIKSGDAKKILIVGAEILSRVSDPYDRDSMIYSDGAGAIILEGKESAEPIGIISHQTRSDTLEHAYLLKMDKSYNPENENKELYLKMQGRKLYEYALKTVPLVVKDAIDKANITLQDIKKVLIHQANGKMDEAILTRIFRLFNEKNIPEGIMPMTIGDLGNNSVATLPILYDLIAKNDFKNQNFVADKYILFASVGAGMNVNAMVYKTQ